MIQTIYDPEHYTGNNTVATFAFNWRILAKTDLLVLSRATDGTVTTLVLDTDYTVPTSSVNNPAGGSITLTGGNLATGVQLFIVRATAETQLVHIEEGSPFPTATVEEVFDRLTMMIQELRYLLRQTLHFAQSSTEVDITAPEPSEGTFLGWVSGLLVNGTLLGDKGAEESVTQDATTFDVVFATATADANYQIVSLTTNWATTVEWSAKATTGFTVTFGNPAPANAKLVWRVLQ